MASPAPRQSGISIMMRPWVEESDPAARPSGPPPSPARRFWRALGQFIFDYNRY
jgi:hypothetical protein